MSKSTVRRAARFLFDQAAKTVRRPWRLLTIPGYMLLQRDRPQAAWWLLRLALKTGRLSVAEYLMAANCLYQGLGRFQDAMALLSFANERSLVEAESLGLFNDRIRVLDNVWAAHIGHLGLLEYAIKLGVLEGRRREDTILYLPPDSHVANRFLLRLIATRLRLIEDPADLPFPPSAVKAFHYDVMAPRMPDRTTAYYWNVAADVHARWHREGRAPLFSFPAEMQARGWTALEKAGIPRGAWFVALHVREREWNGRSSGINVVRNADISTYFPAITEITRRGGWIIRVGDPSMTPLPPLPNVFDYCHSDVRADWMDIFILACCRFLIGTNSGPAFVPALFGTPAVLTNWWPAGERPWQPSDIFLPKLLHRLSDDSCLTLSETLQEPVCWSYSRRHLAQSGVYVADNDAEDIRAAVAEMLGRVDGDLSQREKLANLRSRADRIYRSHGIAGTSELAGGFLCRHDSLIA